MPSVDVIVPCYNYGRFLRECVESVLDQDGVDVRVLIIDDASADDTPDVGRALAADALLQRTIGEMDARLKTAWWSLLGALDDGADLVRLQQLVELVLRQRSLNPFVLLLRLPAAFVP